MQVFEPFLLAFGDGKSIMISTLLLIFLFADLPVNNQLTPYYLTRITKNIWIWGQLLYVFFVTVFYVLFLLLVTCVISGNISFPGNMWSETMALLGYSGAGQKIAISLCCHDFSPDCLLCSYKCNLASGISAGEASCSWKCQRISL